MSDDDSAEPPPPVQPPSRWPGGLVPPTPSAWPGPSPAGITPQPPAPAAPPPPDPGGPVPYLSFSLDAWLAELGGVFRGTIVYRPMDDEAGRADGLRLRVRYRTYGAGASISRVAAEQRWSMAPGAPFTTAFQVGVPGTEPISYEGQILSVRWWVEVTATRPWRSDHSVTADVVVVPVGGAAIYRTPHPYRPVPG